LVKNYQAFIASGNLPEKIIYNSLPLAKDLVFIHKHGLKQHEKLLTPAFRLGSADRLSRALALI
jgi:hypothetical protein